MENDPQNEKMGCPVCGRSFDLLEAAGCSRCGADLKEYAELARKARRLLCESVRALRKDPARALRLAVHGQSLHATDEAGQMILVAQLCSREYQSALMGWLKIRRDSGRSIASNTEVRLG